MVAAFKKTRGFSLIEMLLVVGFIAISLVTVSMLYSKTVRAQREHAKADQEEIAQARKKFEEAAASAGGENSSMASSVEPATTPSPNAGLSKQEAFAREKARIDAQALLDAQAASERADLPEPTAEELAALDAAKREAARDERERELRAELEKTAREASELNAALAHEQAARAQAQSERNQAFADLAQSRAGLAAADSAKAVAVEEQPRWLEIGGAAALALGVLGALGALARRGRSATAP